MRQRGFAAVGRPDDADARAKIIKGHDSIYVL
jgi:hypothetical protein